VILMVRTFADSNFQLIGRIEPERGPDGELLEFIPQHRYRDATTAPLHAYGSGPFCRLRIGRARHEPGLYVLTLNDEPVYAGECVDLGQRWGPNGYGGISPRNCFRGGQPTNCRVNSAILTAVKDGRVIDLWFCPSDGDTASRRATETSLIQSLAPPWNRAKMGASMS
jgi:hypothetical protein